MNAKFVTLIVLLCTLVSINSSAFAQMKPNGPGHVGHVEGPQGMRFGPGGPEFRPDQFLDRAAKMFFEQSSEEAFERGFRRGFELGLKAAQKRDSRGPKPGQEGVGPGEFRGRGPKPEQYEVGPDEFRRYREQTHHRRPYPGQEGVGPGEFRGRGPRPGQEGVGPGEFRGRGPRPEQYEVGPGEFRGRGPKPGQYEGGPNTEKRVIGVPTEAE